MQQRLSFLFFVLMAVAPLLAQVQHGDSAYSVRLDAGYAYNKTYTHYGNFDMGAYMPVNPHFEMQADVRLSTANFYTFGVQMRPKFALPVGAMYVETRALYRAIVCSHFHEVSGGVSLGYRMQYVNVMLGCGMRIMCPMDYDQQYTNRYVLEPFIVLYDLDVFVRPQSSPWNISAGISNMDNYQIERTMQPLFRLGGHYSVTDHWCVYLTAQCKPTGIFHMNANFYGIDVRAGVEYRF